MTIKHRDPPLVGLKGGVLIEKGVSRGLVLHRDGEASQELMRAKREVRNLAILTAEFPDEIFYPRLGIPKPVLDENVLEPARLFTHFGSAAIYFESSDISFTEKHLPGEALADVEHTLSYKDFLRVLLNVGRILKKVANRTGLAFGDLHGRNILVGTSMEVYLVDWETAALIGRESFLHPMLAMLEHPELFYFYYNCRLSFSSSIKTERFLDFVLSEQLANPLSANSSQDMYALTMYIAKYLLGGQIYFSNLYVHPWTFRSSEEYRQAVNSLIKSKLKASEKELKEKLKAGSATRRDLLALEFLPFILKYLSQPYNSDLYRWDIWLTELENTVNRVNIDLDGSSFFDNV